MQKGCIDFVDLVEIGCTALTVDAGRPQKWPFGFSHRNGICENAILVQAIDAICFSGGKGYVGGNWRATSTGKVDGKGIIA